MKPMKWNFWSKPAPKPLKRGYFDMVAAADITVGVAGGTTPPPVVTGELQAMRLAAVYRCVSVLSGSVASLPLQLKRKTNGYFAVDEKNHLNYLLTKRANKKMTAFDTIANAVVRMKNAGNAYIYPKYRAGEIDELILLSPGSVTYDKLLDMYLVSDMINNIFETLDSDEIIHLRNMSLDGGYTGVSTIYYGSKVFSVNAAEDAQSYETFKPGSSYSGFVSGENATVKGFGEYQDSQLETVGKRVQKQLQSGDRVFWLPEGMKFNQLSMSMADMQLMEAKKFSVLDICRFYGVHPDKAFAGQSQNYKASEMSQVQFMTDTLQPLLRQIENEFTVKLIPESLSDKYRIEFDVEAFYQTDLETMATWMEKNIQYGSITVNEWRKNHGRPAVEGGEVAMMSCNVAPINSPKLKGEEKNTPTVENLPPKSA